MPLFSNRGGNAGGASKDDAILAIAVAEPTFSSSLQLTSTGKAGLTYKPASGDAFAELEQEVLGLLHSGQQNTGTRYTVETDEYGYRWVLLADEQFEDLAMGLYVVGQSFFERGARDLLLAAVFPFMYQGQEVQWIFTHKRGTYYPFAPIAETHRRNNELELELAAKVEEHLPVEKRLEQWFALWGAPFQAI